MSKQTLASIRREIQAYIGDENADTELHLTQIINDAETELFYSYDWWFRKGERQFTTVAPYETGTATATNGSATVTISGGTFAGKVGRKFSFGVNSPYSRIIAVATNGLSCTLESAWAGDTTSAAPFVYQDVYAVPEEIAKIHGVRLLRGGWPALTLVPQESIAYLMSVPDQSGIPVNWFSGSISEADTDQALRIGLYPVPSATYTVEVSGELNVVPMSSDSDTPTVPAQAIPCLKTLALYRAYTLDFQNSPEATQVYQEYTRQLDNLKRMGKDIAAGTVYMKSVDDRRGDSDWLFSRRRWIP